jgi:hypothetical protein
MGDVTPVIIRRALYLELLRNVWCHRECGQTEPNISYVAAACLPSGGPEAGDKAPAKSHLHATKHEDAVKMVRPTFPPDAKAKGHLWQSAG